MPVSQFAHKQPTRFNEPEIPQDLVTKQYVDARSGTGYCFGMLIYGSLFNWGVVNSFTHEAGTFTANASTESIFTTAVHHSTFICIRGQLRVETNTLNGGSQWRERDDGANVWEITVATTLTGLFDTGAISVSIADGSLICKQFDTWQGGASTSGSIHWRVWVSEYST